MVAKYVLKVSHFCDDIFLLQSLQSSLKMTVLKTRLFEAEITCYGEYEIDVAAA